jgi:hypothetical protein
MREKLATNCPGTTGKLKLYTIFEWAEPRLNEYVTDREIKKCS